MAAIVLWVALAPDGLYPSATYASTDTSLSADSPAHRAARRQVPDHFTVHETTRYVLLTDGDRGWTIAQGQLLERAHHQFQRYCRRMGITPDPLRHKLVAVGFRDRSTYQRFARTHDEVSNPNLSGYYSPRNDRVVFYDVETNPSVTEARDRLDEMRAEIRDLDLRAKRAAHAGDEEQAEALRTIHARYRQHITIQRNRVNDFSAQTGVATIAHEAIHQLMFHTNVQSPKTQYPLWICEGLATTFETDTPQAAFGPDHEYPPRRQGFLELTPEQRIPLRELITISDLAGADESRTTAVYHQSYALTTWLCRFRQRELHQFLAAMRRLPGGRPSPQQHLEHFIEAFGDVERLEQAWWRHEESTHGTAARAMDDRR